MTLVFLDTETTGLDRERHQVWEIGAIVRGVDVDVEHHWIIRPDLSTASPDGLRIGRYYDRIGPLRGCLPGAARRITPNPTSINGPFLTAGQVAAELAPLFDGATLVGAVPDFDAEILRRWLRANGQADAWHYHLVEVETLAAGALRKPPPWGLDDLLKEFGLVYDEADRHTALGDARMVRDLYDAALKG